MAVYQSQLGNVIRVLDVEEDSVIATAVEMGTVRAFIFNQTTDNINVTFPNPLPTSEKLLTVVNRGTVSLNIQGVDIEPGPAYGFFWDGTAYQPTMVDGVGMVSHIEETDTVKFVGNGEELTPLTAEVKVSPQPSNVIQVTAEGLFVGTSGSNLGLGRILWVDTNIGDDITGDGTLSQPYKTFAKAMSISTTTDRDTIVILPGDYEEDLELLRDINIEGLVEGNKVVRFLGKVTNLPDVGGITVKNIAVYKEGTDPAFESFGFEDGVVFTNVKITNDDPTSKVMEIAGNNKGTLKFVDSEIAGAISIIDNIQDVTHRVILDRVTGVTKTTLDSTRSTLLVQNIDKIGYFEHTKGNLYLQNVNNIKPEVNGRAIISQALFNDGYLGLKSVNLRQLDGSFAAIDKSGDCDYYFDDVSRSISNLSFAINGSKLLSNQAADINAGIVVENYVPIGPSVAGHLAGIDDKLADMIEDVVVADTSTIQTLGTGTTADPFQPSLKISADPKNTLEVLPDGVMVKSSAEISKGVTYFVDTVIGDDIDNDGTFGAPFKTITKALSLVNRFDMIKIFPGEYIEDLELEEERFEGVLLEGMGVIGAAQVRVKGHVLFSNGVIRPRFKNLSLVGITAGISTVTFMNMEGRVNFDAVSFTHELGNGQTVANFAGDNNNDFYFTDCEFDGKIDVSDPSQQLPITINLIRPYGDPQIELDCIPATVAVYEARSIYAPIHTTGNLILDGVSRVRALTGVSINSSCAVGQGSLSLKNVNLRQANGTFGQINKTGTCPYLLANVVRDIENDVLNGNASLNTHGADYHGNYVPTNYDIVGLNIPAHFAGIDKHLSRYIEAVINFDSGWADEENLFEWPVTRQPFSLPALLVGTKVRVTNPEVGTDTFVVFQKKTPANVVTEVGRIHITDGSVALSGSGATFEEDDELLLVTENGATFGRVAINLLAGKV